MFFLELLLVLNRNKLYSRTLDVSMRLTVQHSFHVDLTECSGKEFGRELVQEDRSTDRAAKGELLHIFPSPAGARRGSCTFDSGEGPLDT